MAGGVLVFGIVAAAHVAALLANAQVHPGIAQGYALGAYVLGIVLEMAQVERGEVLARSIHRETGKVQRGREAARPRCKIPAGPCLPAGLW
jgi:hypothetical protein